MLVHEPIPGYWYANIKGQLMQVRAVLYEGARANRTILEYINGRRESMTLSDWYRLDLSLHSPGIEHSRNRNRRGQAE